MSKEYIQSFYWNRSKGKSNRYIHMNDALYKKFAKYYDKLYKNKDYLREIFFADNIIKKYLKSKRKYLLDVACGTGNHTLLFKRKGYVTTGIDSSSEMLRIARKKNKLIEFIKADMRNFSLKNNFQYGF